MARSKLEEKAKAVFVAEKKAKLYSVSPEVSALAFLLGGGSPGTTAEEMSAAIQAALHSR
jgi:hypothetical protein